MREGVRVEEDGREKIGLSGTSGVLNGRPGEKGEGLLEGEGVREMGGGFTRWLCTAGGRWSPSLCSVI